MLREDCLKRLQDGCLSDILVFAVKQLKLQFSCAGQDVKFLREYPISTHAPTGGATAGSTRVEIEVYISTHAPAGGATKPLLRTQKRSVYFYSRPCGRGDGSIQ